MNKTIYTYARRTSLTVLLSVCFLLGAFADNVVKINDFNIAPGEQREVAIELVNSDAISSLQMDIYLPAGIEYVANSVKRDELRLDRDEHSIMMNKQSDGAYRFTAFTTRGTEFVGNEGAIAYFTVKAAGTFTSLQTIRVTEIHGGVGAQRVDFDEFDVKVSPRVATVSFVEETLDIKPDGATAVPVTVQMTSDVDLYGMQLDITLSEGLKLKNKEGKDYPQFTYGDIVSQNMTVTSSTLPNGDVRVIVSSAAPAKFIAREGTVFGFSVIAEESFTETGKLTIHSMMASNLINNMAVTYPIEGQDVVNFINAKTAYLNAPMQKVAELKAALDEAVKKVEAEAADVKDTETFANRRVDIETSIANLEKAVNDAYANNTLKDNAETIMAPATEIAVSIEKYVADALAAQKAFEENAAKKAANEEAYSKLIKEIAGVQATLETVKTSVATDCKDVAAQFAVQFDEFQKAIDALIADVKAKYDNVELTAESTIETASILASIEKIKTDAAAAQKAFEEDAAKKVANEEAYSKLTKEIAGVQATLETVKTSVAADCKDVAAQFAVQFDEAQKAIDALTADVKAKYDNVELTAESTIETASILASIEKIKTDAAAAQKVFEENAAKKIANEAAYESLTEELNNLQDQLDFAWLAIQKECKDVYLSYWTVMNDISRDIETARKDLTAQYQKIELTAESTVPSETITAAINKLLTDAKQAQAKVDADAAAKAANDEAFVRLTQVITGVQNTLKDAKTFVATECADVKGKFDSEFDKVQEAIDALTTDLENKHRNIELTATSKVETAEVLAAIEKIKTDAVAAQAAHDAEVAKDEANKAAYARLNAEIAKVQAALDAAIAEVAENCPAVKDNFTTKFAEIQVAIKALADDVQAKYDNVQLTAESTVDTASVLASIEQIKKDAAAAQKVYEEEQVAAIEAANQAAYDRLTEELDDLLDELDLAWFSVMSECKDVYLDFYATQKAISKDIEALRKEVTAQYQKKELNEESTIDTEAIEEAIAKMVEDAKQAQKDYEIETSIGDLKTVYKGRMSVYNMTGSLVKTFNANGKDARGLQISELPNGIYVVKTTEKTFKIVKK